MKRFLTVLAMAGAALAAGCETTTGPSSARMAQATSDEQALANYSRSYQVQGAIAGCVAGGILATIIANNTGDGDVDNDEVAKGCAAGAVAGAFGGRAVAARQQEYGSVEQRTQATLTAAQAELADATEQVARMERVVERNVAALDTAKTKLAAGQMTAEAYNDEVAYARQMANNIDGIQKGLRAEIDAVEASLAESPQGTQTHAQLTSVKLDLERAYREMASEYDLLASAIIDAEAAFQV